MESNPVSPPSSSDDFRAATQGELVVQNGRLRGARRALGGALTLLGRDPCCEFHLTVDSVHPLHCAIVRGPEGFEVRDLGSATGTFLNGEAVQQSPLRHGDRLTVGPFEFCLHLPQADDPLDVAALQRERDALRIQAAAVAAQQACLIEEESQLRQRRKSLARQKEQLAAHLDERRQQLLDLREQARKDREALQAERQAVRRQNEEVRVALAKEREAVHKELEQANKERRRFIELRKRLKKRWQKHWQGHETVLQRREQELKTEETRIEREEAKLQRERVQLTQAQLRFNGEVELGRRQLQDEWQQLGMAQQQWETCLNQEQSERTRRLRELEQRESVVSASEQNLCEHRQRAEQLQLHLRKEAEGLESRIRNQRLKLQDQEQQLKDAASRQPKGELDAEPQPTVVVRLRDLNVPRVLARLADNLADQRRHLLDQWHSLVELHEAWEPERSAILTHFEAAARELVLVEQRLTTRERSLSVGETELRRCQQTLFEVRAALEAWQARLTARETFLDNERVMLLADVRAREESAEAQMQRLEDMRQRRARRRGQEIEELRIVRENHEQLRRDYALLWQECQDRRAQLIRQERELSAKALALEQFRYELLQQVEDTPESDKRLRCLERHNLARLRAEERELKRERAALMAETKRLDRRAVHLLEQEEALVARHEDWMKQVADWEDRRAATDALEQRRQHELRHWQLLHEQDERQLTELRDEIERIARLLLDEAEALAPPINQAA
jgi:hypothetical protein